MKHSKITLFILAATLLSVNVMSQMSNEPVDSIYGTKPQNEKQFDSWKRVNTPDKLGGYVQANLGGSPSHTRVYAGFTAGVIYKYVGVSATVNPDLGNLSQKDAIHLFNTMLEFRMPTNRRMIFVPKIGYWAYWNGDSKIDWNKGNHVCYGGDAIWQTEGAIQVVFSFIDYRGDSRNLQPLQGSTKLVGAEKVVTAGIRCIF